MYSLILLLDVHNKEEESEFRSSAECYFCYFPVNKQISHFIASILHAISIAYLILSFQSPEIMVMVY